MRYLTVVLAVAAVALASAPAAAQELPRTPWGAPDLQGVWDFRTLTPMERPDELEAKDVYTEEEAAEFEARRLAEIAALDDEEPADIVGNYNQFWFDRGTTVVQSNRTSLVTDPPDGRIPPLTAAAEARRAAEARAREGTGRHMPTPGGFTEDLGSNGLQVRCPHGVQLRTADGAARLQQQRAGVPDRGLRGAAHRNGPRRPHRAARRARRSCRPTCASGRAARAPIGTATRWWSRRPTSCGRRASCAAARRSNLHLTERLTRVAPDTLLYDVRS